MRFFALILVLFLAISIFPQTEISNSVQFVKEQRAIRIKADILQDIQLVSPKDQAYFYTYLGNMIWRYDQKEGDFWLAKGVEIGVNPATEYRDEADRLSSYWNLLHNVLDENDVLSNRLISKIKEIKIDETNFELLESANKTYILIAQQILSRKEVADTADINLAFEFAMLSLKGKKPAITDSCIRFILNLKYKNENLSNIYFTKLAEAAQNTGNSGAFIYYLFENNFSAFQKMWRNSMPDSRVKVFLELMLPIIQKESENINLKKQNDCFAAKNWGLKYFEDFKRLLPAKLLIIEKALAVCQNAPIPVWNKPDFTKRPRKTSQDFLNLAKEITDKKTRARYLMNASLFARQEKNFQLSNEILDSIDKEFRESVWTWQKVDTYSKLIEELFKSNNLDEITNVLKSVPQEYRPFAIIGGLSSLPQLKPEQTEFVLDLLKQARADFNKMDKITSTQYGFATNPTRFGQITKLYVKFGYIQEAVATHEETILSLNRVLKTIPFEEFDKNPYHYVMPDFNSIYQYSKIQNYSTGDDIDAFYNNLGKIENKKIRLRERLWFLSPALRQTVNQ